MNRGDYLLLIEDNPDDVALTKRALRKHHVVNHVEVVTDGAEALDFLFARNAYEGRTPAGLPRVVLLDLNLPKVNGIDVLRAIRQDPRTDCLPVVILTSSLEQRDVVESYRLGVNSYVRKPVDFEEFVEAARQLGLYWMLLNQRPRGDET